MKHSANLGLIQILFMYMCVSILTLVLILTRKVSQLVRLQYGPFLVIYDTYIAKYGPIATSSEQKYKLYLVKLF